MSKILAAYITPMQMFFLLIINNIDKIVSNYVLAMTMTMIKFYTLLTLQWIIMH